jgi:plasmanylethanolamine desaturase
MVVLEVLAVVVLADLVSGAIHWIEDSYFKPDTPILGKYLIQPNLVHHAKPREFIAKTYWQSSGDLWLVGAAVVAGAWTLDALTWHVWLFVALAANANQFHKWSHQSREEVGPIVWALQRARILLTQQHHAGHHLGAKDSHYCTVTNFVNPVLDDLCFWYTLERAIVVVSGVERRVDPTVKPADIRLAAIRSAKLAERRAF